MRSSIPFLALILVVPSSRSAAQARADSSRVAEVRTAGSSTRSVPPDVATISIEFTAKGANGAEAGRHLAARADSIRRAISTLGIPRDSLISRSRWYWWHGRIDVTINPAHCVLPSRPPMGATNCERVAAETSYTANDAIEVRIHDLSRVGAVLDTVMGRGITEISPVRFTATDISAAQDQALREATLRARAQAEAIAAAGGMQLGRVLSLSTESDSPDEEFSVRGISTGSVVIDGREATPGTIVVQPSISVSVTVYGRWELVAKQ